MQSDSDKVVSLDAQARAAKPESSGALIKVIREAVLNALMPRVEQALDQVDDALFDLAEKAENNQVQAQFFDGMREVRRKRALVLRLFGDALKDRFELFSEKGLTPPQAGKEDAEEGELSLVEDRELEETLAVSNMVARADSHYARELFALNKRLGVLRGGDVIEDDTNPMGPAQITDAFATVCHEFDIEISALLIVFKLFEKDVLATLGPLLADANQRLVEAGVLPNIKGQIARRGPRGYKAPSVQDAPSDPEEALLYEDDVGGGFEAGGGGAGGDLDGQILNTLQTLLSSRHGGGGGTMQGGIGVGGPTGSGAGQYAGGGAAVSSSAEILNALRLLQSQNDRITSLGQGLADRSMSPMAVKNEVVRELDNLGAGSIRTVDEDTMDLVAMLFEFVLNDRNLPGEVQASLARLQIPYLKLAMMDRHFFAQRQHPARRLLNELAVAGLSWSPTADRDGKLLGKIDTVVETLLHKFDEDLTIFEEMLEEFSDFSEQYRRRADATEKRTAESVRGKEKLNHARRLAAEQILKRVESGDLPRIVHEILTKPWANVLVLTHLRQGEDSPPWKKALRVADELVWSGVPKAADHERKRLKALMPQLYGAVRKGLELVAYHESDIQVLLDELEGLHRRLLGTGDESGGDELPATIEELAELDLTEAASKALPEAGFVEEIAEEPELEANERLTERELPPDFEELLAAVRTLRVGTWVEMELDGEMIRAKLSWISPITGKLLFVNRKGLKVTDVESEQLVEMIAEKRAVVLEDVPLFERALGSIVNRLQEEQSGGEDAQDDAEHLEASASQTDGGDIDLGEIPENQ